MRSFNGKFSEIIPALVAGGVAVLVGFTSAIAILFQAASAMGLSIEQTSSMIAALCLGAGVTSIVNSARTKTPILMAFSTTGAALLAMQATKVPYSEMVGAFLFCAILIIVAGQSGLFERAMNRIPTPLASAMLGGVLFRFGLEIFGSMKTQLHLVSAMLVAYLLMKRLAPRFAVIAVLIIGLGLSYYLGLVNTQNFAFHLSTPVLTVPSFSAQTLLGVGIPLFIVTMASQNLPGIAVMRAFGYHPPVSKVIAGTGVATLLLSPFGGFGINFAAITAAIVMGPEAHEDPRKRYVGAIAAGVLYIVVAVSAATVILFFQSLPTEFVSSLAGIALIGTIANSLTGALKDEASREPAILTFLVTASGLAVFGIGSAFWGLVVGIGAQMILSWRRKTI